MRLSMPGSRPRGWEPLRLALVALRFLTRLPLPDAWHDGDDLRRAAPWFPLVGLVVAGVGIGVRAALGPLFGGATATVAALAAMVALTGALHEDGLADTADGLWGGHDPERRLAIMRDSRIGTYGMVALLTVIGLRVSLLLPLGLAPFARAVACGQVLGRASILLLARLLPAATPATPATQGARIATTHPSGGPPDASLSGSGRGAPGLSTGADLGNGRLGAAMSGPLRRRGALAAALVVGGTALVAAGRWAPVPLAAALAATLACAGLFRRRLGGLTGDTFGAAALLADLAAVAAVVGLHRAALL
jgi:adenosylcobinamide-GDP ribazoletransferase